MTICIYVYVGEQEDLPERKFADISVKGRATTGSGFVASNNLKSIGPSNNTIYLETNTGYFVEGVSAKGGFSLKLPDNATHGDTINIFGTSPVADGCSLYVLAPGNLSFSAKSVLTRSHGANGRVTSTPAGSEPSYNSIRIIGDSEGGGAGYNIDCTYINNKWFAYGNFFAQDPGTNDDGTAWGGPGSLAN